jgi:F0F1-type ATP synthase gamma subunit
MSLKNVVKVMNFHSLLRVDSSRKIAYKYAALEGVTTEMIDNIVNNRNIALDVAVLKVKPEAPILNIYIGSDLGFCANLNSLVNRQLAADEADEEETRERHKIIIGKKIHIKNMQNVQFNVLREAFDEDHIEILKFLDESIRTKRYSQINIIYNHYYNATEVEFVKRCIYPLPKHFGKKTTYNEDFAYEGEIEDLLINLMILYLQYELEIAANVSYAAENIYRQNVTTESLKRIDEREEEQHKVELREEKDKQFAKVLDNYTKLNNY